MISIEELKRLLPLISSWVEEEEKFIFSSGVALNENQIMDAVDAGVRKPDLIRLQKVIKIPSPSNPQLDLALKLSGIIHSGTIGLTLGHSIYLRSDHWENRKLQIHEFAHVMQYERLGGISNFLNQYLTECIVYGYKNAPLEQEAIKIQQEIK